MHRSKHHLVYLWSIGLIAFWLPVADLFSQNQLSGQVMDQNEDPLIAAMIIASIDSLTNQITDYAISGENGAFTIKLSVKNGRQAQYLAIKHLGFKDTLLRIESIGESARIKLYPSQTGLPSVKVNAKRIPGIEKGDTISYDVQSFRDSSDQVAEDVIKKLPGVEVDENGLIKVNGKSIKTVLVDESELLGRQYNMGTRSINIRHIDRINVIQNYEPNRLKQSLSLSDDVVLQLQLNENAKNIWFGNLTAAAGAGFEFKHNVNNKLYHFSGGFNSLSVNTIKNASEGYTLAELEASLGNYDNRPNTDFLQDPLANIINITNTSIDPNLADNAQHIFSGNKLEFEITTSSKAILDIYYTDFKDRQNIKEEIEYIASDNNFKLENNERKRVHKGLLLLKSQFKLFQDAKKFNMEAELSYQTNFDNGNLRISPQAYRNNMILNRNQIGGNIKTFLKLNNKALWQNNIRFSSKTRSYNNNFSNSLYSDLLSGETQLTQALEESNNQADVQSQLIYQSNLGLSSFFGTYKYADYTLETFFNQPDSLFQIDGFESRPLQSNQLHQMQLGWKHNKNYGSHEFSSLLSYSYASFQGNTKFNLSTPQAFVSHKTKWDSKWTTNIIAAYSESNPAPWEMVQASYFRNLFSIRNQLFQKRASRTSYLQSNIQFFDLMNSLNFTLGSRVTFVSDLWLENISFINSQIQLNESVFTKGNQSINGYLRISKFIAPLGLHLSMYNSLSLDKLKIPVDEELIQADMLNGSIDLELKGRFFDYWFLRIKNRYNRQLSLATTAQNQSAQTNETSIRLQYIRNGWKVKAEMDHLYVSSMSSESNLFTSGNMRVEKKVSIKSFESNLFLEVHNLFNSRNYSELNQTNLFVLSRSISLVPTFFIVGFSTDF